MVMVLLGLLGVSLLREPLKTALWSSRTVNAAELLESVRRVGGVLKLDRDRLSCKLVSAEPLSSRAVPLL
jgi:hypothetical protein